MIPPPRKRRKTSAGGQEIEEIKFDLEAREEYLTGFHKRKVQRIKQAQALAAKRERAEKLEQRRKLRQGRKEAAQKHVESVNTWLREAARRGNDSDDEEEEEGDEWNGIEENNDGPTTVERVVDREDEYVDEDRYTTVTVEAIDVSRLGGLRSVAETTEEVLEQQNLEGNDDGREQRDGEEKTKPLSQTKDHLVRRMKKKKRKKSFRYENKAERKVSKSLQRMARAKKGGRR